MLLIHPPIAKPCEPPAGIAKLAAAIGGYPVSVIDANIEAILHAVNGPIDAEDTWTRRAIKNLDRNISYLRDRKPWNFDKYSRAVMDINRLLDRSACSSGARLTLGNFQHKNFSPVNSSDLIRAAETPEENPFYSYFKERFIPHDDGLVGISLNFLSQAVTSFAVIGHLKKKYLGIKIILGGGLVTSWIKNPAWNNPFTGLIDHMVAGPGENFMQNLLGVNEPLGHVTPDYNVFPAKDYLSPGFILPYSASSGCYWQKCRFCPEKAEGNPYVPVDSARVLNDLSSLIDIHQPGMVHILDNAISPSLLKGLIKNPLKAPWYGFVRITDHFKDPEFSMGLKKSGCAMLKIGVESGDQGVLDALNKGIKLDTVSTALKNIKDAGIGTYLYFLFGTPPEGKKEAGHTLDFVKKHHSLIDFMNTAIFNMPVNGPDAGRYGIDKFYEGDLSLYSGFDHPKGWNRGNVRSFLDNEFKKDPDIRKIILRNPPFFTSNHAAFFLPG